MSELRLPSDPVDRMLRNLSEGEPTCLTATRLDSLVLARGGFTLRTSDQKKQ